MLESSTCINTTFQLIVMTQVSLLTPQFSLVLFGTNISNEWFEFVQAFSIETKEMKEMLLRSVDGIFDESSKEWVRN